jgi:hypothetical protein
MDGAFKKHTGIGGWEYTVSAHIHEYQHEASGGHAACTKEGQRVTQDMDCRTIVSVITLGDGKHRAIHNAETNVHQRPSHQMMTGEMYVPETARALALGLEIAGLSSALGTTYFSLDGANENLGRDLISMFDANSVLYSLQATREPWREVYKLSDDCGVLVGPRLRQLNALEDLPGLIKELKLTFLQERTARSQASKAKAQAKTS